MPNLSEIETDAIDLADTVVLARDRVRDIHTDGASVVGDNLTHWRRVQSAHPAGPQPKPRERVRHVVFAAADPYFERRGKLDPPVPSRRQPNHTLAQRHQIELTRIGRFYFQCHWGKCSASR